MEFTHMNTRSFRFSGFCFAVNIQKTRVKQASGLNIAHRRKQCFFQMRMFFFEFPEHIA
jgi:hypothetical protein